MLLVLFLGKDQLVNIAINVTVGNRYIKLYTQETKIRSLSFDQFQIFEKQITAFVRTLSHNQTSA